MQEQDGPALDDIALSYLQLLERSDLHDVLVIGSLADFFSLTPQELISHAFHDPAAVPDPAQLPQEARDMQAANAATLAVYDGDPYMHDPKLRRRLALVPTPVVAIRGESDEIAPEPYGRAYAASFPNGRFELIREAGHLPHLERPEQVLDAIRRFAAGTARLTV